MNPFDEADLKMYFYENRLKTYEGWPFIEDCLCTPENMARAGFIHTPSENSPDIAMCFFCLKELEGWEPEDDPDQNDENRVHISIFMHLTERYSTTFKNHEWSLLFTLLRKEHKSHSPSCHFIALKKNVEELTVEELFHLQKEKHKFMIKKNGNDAIAKFEEAAKLKNTNIIKTAMGEE